MVGSFIQDDLATIFASSEFGEADGTVLWNGVEVEGAIFDNEGVEFQMGEGVSQIAEQPVLIAPSAQFNDDLADGDIFIIRDTLYRLKNWLDDGTGVVEMMFEKVT